MPLKDIVDLMLKVNVGAYSIEEANPRHEHEWTVWESVKLPPGKNLIPGVISHATNIVEHPELVAERIVRLAKSSAARTSWPAPTAASRRARSRSASIPRIMWAKLRSLSEGARLASEQWGDGGARLERRQRDGQCAPLLGPGFQQRAELGLGAGRGRAMPPGFHAQPTSVSSLMW